MFSFPVINTEAYKSMNDLFDLMNELHFTGALQLL